MIVILICAVVAFTSCYLAWRKDWGAKPQTQYSFIADGPPPSLYEHWDARRKAGMPTMAALARFSSSRRYYYDDDGYMAKWQWEDKAECVWAYLEMVDLFVSTGRKEVVEQIADAAIPLFDNYEKHYTDRRKRIQCQ